MNTKVTCMFVSCFALANAGLVAVPSVNILEGPSTRTKIVGPDGSIIDAYAPGGKIVLDNNAGPLLQPAPLVLSQAAIPEPYVYSALEFKQAVRVVEPVQQIKVESSDSNDIQDSFVPISKDVQKILLQPDTPLRVESRASVPITEETEETTATTEVLYTTEDIGTATPDLSGAYVQDNFEKLYDDGSYRTEHY